MTHDELVKDLDACIKGAEYGPYEWGFIALRAVVELHKPITTPNNFSYCPECQYGHARGVYPCPTIQAIEKELSHVS
jgi:hypothetical protein